MTLKEKDLSQFSKLLEIFPSGVVAIDLETTGLSPLIDRIIDFAAIKVTTDGISELSSLINPQIPIPANTTEIHGITDSDVADSPRLKEFLPQALNFMGDLPIIAHNAKFDLGFIVFSLHQLGLDYPNNPTYCSLKMSRFAFRELTSHKLGHLSEKLNIILDQHHRALDDAIACLHVFNKAVQRLSAIECKSALKQSYLFNTSEFSKNNDMKLKEPTSQLADKAKKQQLVFIKYRGGTFKNVLRPVKPLSLLLMPEGNILYAQCFLTDMYKSFALRKISLVQEMNAEQIQDAHKHLEKLKK
jgi:DNA polymerase-3 subunit epsilon